MRSFFNYAKNRILYSVFRIIFILGIAFLISKCDVFAMTAPFWADNTNILRPVMANVYDCGSNSCSDDLSADFQIVGDVSNGYSQSFYNQTTATSMSANGTGVMWAYQTNTNLSATTLYSLTTYICHNSDANLVYKGLYGASAVANVTDKSSAVNKFSTSVLTNLSAQAFSQTYFYEDYDFNKCGYINVIFKPTQNTKWLGLNFTLDSASTNYKSSLIGYQIDALGNADGLSSSDIQDVIDDSGLASATDIEDLQESVGDIQTSLDTIESSINNNINSAEDNITSSIEDSESNIKDSIQDSTDSINQGIKDGFEECRDSYNLFDKNKYSYLYGTSKSVLDTGIRVTMTTSGNYRYIAIKIGGSELLGKTLTITTDILVSSNNMPGYILFFGNSSSPVLKSISSVYNKSGSNTITIPSSFPENTDGIYIIFYGNFSGTGNIGDYVDYTNLRVVDGSSSKPYEPYGEQICSNRIDETNDKLDNLNDSINSDSENFEDKSCGMICKLGKIPGKIIDGLIDGLKSLFIPKNTDFINNFVDSIENKLGFIASIPMQFIEFILSLVNASWETFDSISFPSIDIFGYKFWDAQEIDLTEAINIFKPFRYVTDVLAVVLFCNTLLKWWENFTGGKN